MNKEKASEVLRKFCSEGNTYFTNSVKISKEELRGGINGPSNVASSRPFFSCLVSNLAFN